LDTSILSAPTSRGVMKRHTQFVRGDLQIRIIIPVFIIRNFSDHVVLSYSFIKVKILLLIK
jgi:hypothetical protein